jgi:hypothetical protein
MEDAGLWFETARVHFKDATISLQKFRMATSFSERTSKLRSLNLAAQAA